MKRRPANPQAHRLSSRTDSPNHQRTANPLILEPPPPRPDWSLVKEGNERWENLEPGPYLDLLSDSVQVYLRGARYGPDEYEKVVRSMMPAYEAYAIEVGDIHVDVLGREAVVVSYPHMVRAVDTTGTSETFQAALTSVVHRQNGEWKVVQMHESRARPTRSE